MSRRKVPEADGNLHRVQPTPTTTSFEASEPISGHAFKIFSDERHTGTPRRFAPPSSNALFNDSNDENINTAPTFKFVNKLNTKLEPVPSVKRTPLADVTQEIIHRHRPHSLSAALAEIARLEDELEVCTDKVKELKGDIVAYQDALNQAERDAGYF